MIEPNHTPGPWEIQWASCDCEPPCSCKPWPYSLDAPDRLVRPYDGAPMDAAEIVCFENSNSSLPPGEHKANCLLIAAAPDLLEACLKANRMLARLAENGGRMEVEEWSDVQQSLALAILNAGGKLR